MATPNITGAGGGDSLSPGDRIGGGRYLLKRLLGRGSGAEVWLAQDAKAGRIVALKFFPRAFLLDTNLVELLKRKAQTQLLAKHPNVATTYELVSDQSNIALAVEYVEGWSLASMKVDRLGGYYTIEEIEKWVEQLCAALIFSHEELGIVHNDLKPANLLVNAQEDLKVTDFVLAALVRKECSRRGLVKGLYSGLGFLSPQQVMGEEPSKLDDIYSLGATIFDLLTGTAPFYKGEVFAQICSLPPPSMTARLQELEMQDEPISPVWEDTVARCLAKNPKERPQSVGEVLELLKRTELPKPAGTEAAVENKPTVDAIAEKVIVPEAKKEEPQPLPEVVESETIPTPSPDEAAVETATGTPVTPTLPETPKPDAAPLVAPQPRSHLPLILGGFAVLVVAVGMAAAIAVVKLKHEVTTAQTQGGSTTNAAVSLVPGAPGSMDSTFNIGEGANGEVMALAVQPDGKILAAGKFSTFNGSQRRNMVRLNPDGSLDEMFEDQGVGPIHAIALGGDGGIFIPAVNMVKGHPRYHIARLNGDGVADKSFGSGLRLNLEVRALAVQPDGEVLAGGNFNAVNGKKQEHIVRFEPDGKPDEDFNANVLATDSVWALAVQPDGKILVGGAFTQFSGADANRLARLNADGAPDKQFSIGTGADGTVESLVVQHDGAILIGGAFTHVNGQPCPHVARLNPDGTVDTTFAIGAGADKNVRSLAVQPDGKIIVVGDFITFENIPCHRIVRLNPDGSVDKSFDAGSGAANFIDCVALQADGKVLAGGGFTAFNGTGCGELVRLNNSHAHP